MGKPSNNGDEITGTALSGNDDGRKSHITNDLSSGKFFKVNIGSDSTDCLGHDIMHKH